MSAPADDQVLTHECPAALCTEHVGPDMLMCSGRWYQVPKPLRRAVRIAWRRGVGAGARPTHRAAMRAAITAVNRDVVPASSIKHPARGTALESTPRAGFDSQHRPGGQHR